MRFLPFGRRKANATIARLQAEVDRLRVEKAIARYDLYAVREAYHAAIDHGDQQAFLAVGVQLDAAVAKTDLLEEHLVDRQLYEPLVLAS